MKKKVLLSSILTIALCLCLIAGSTFALFTSRSEVNIVATAGKVNVEAGLTAPVLYSVEEAADGATDTVADENGHLYTYVEQNGTFANGGTATLDAGTLTLDKITPGDKVEFSLTSANASNVAILYRYTVQCISGYDLMYGLKVTIGQTTYESLDTYVSAWTALAPEEQIDDVTFTIELPVTAGNEYQNLDAEINILVEAVQGNAVVEGVETVTYLQSAATVYELETLLTSDAPYVRLGADIVADATTGVLTLTDVSNKTIDANGHVLEIALNGTLENVIVTNVADNGDATPAINLAGASGDVTIRNCDVFDAKSVPYGAIAGGTADLSITVENCTVSGDRPIYASGSIANFTIRDSVIENTGSWGILYNGTVFGDIVIEDCTFIHCVGLFKAGIAGTDTSGAIENNVVIKNNRFIDCTTKNNVYMDIDPIYGELTFEGNTMTVNGVTTSVTAADMLGIDAVPGVHPNP